MGWGYATRSQLEMEKSVLTNSHSYFSLHFSITVTNAVGNRLWDRNNTRSCLFVGFLLSQGLMRKPDLLLFQLYRWIPEAFKKPMGNVNTNKHWDHILSPTPTSVSAQREWGFVLKGQLEISPVWGETSWCRSNYELSPISTELNDETPIDLSWGRPGS